MSTTMIIDRQEMACAEWAGSHEHAERTVSALGLSSQHPEFRVMVANASIIYLADMICGSHKLQCTTSAQPTMAPLQRARCPEVV
jgi:hypothetical protein